jgi:hypothetical protein
VIYANVLDTWAYTLAAPLHSAEDVPCLLPFPFATLQAQLRTVGHQQARTLQTTDSLDAQHEDLKFGRLRRRRLPGGNLLEVPPLQEAERRCLERERLEKARAGRSSVGPLWELQEVQDDD